MHFMAFSDSAMLITVPFSFSSHMPSWVFQLKVAVLQIQHCVLHIKQLTHHPSCLNYFVNVQPSLSCVSKIAYCGCIADQWPRRNMSYRRLTFCCSIMIFHHNKINIGISRWKTWYHPDVMCHPNEVDIGMRYHVGTNYYVYNKDICHDYTDWHCCWYS